MHILAIISGEYGRRNVDNIGRFGPPHWLVKVWQAPRMLPLIVDYPEDYLPDSLPPADLILSFAEHQAVAQLLPEAACLTGAKAVITAIDNETWLPRGLARQLRGWLQDMGVACVTPKPLCSLTETHYNITRRQQIVYDDPLISEFARHFGRPQLQLNIDSQSRKILSATVKRDSVCGCARFVAQGLIGVSVDEAEEQAGLLHHHYPCMASMGIDVDYDDTLMHVSGNLIKDNVGLQIKPFKQQIKPGHRTD